MLKVYQTIIDPGRGNCLQAVIATLFEDELENVPHFLLAKEGWFKSLYYYVQSKEHEFLATLYNPNSFGMLPGYECRFKELKEKYKGINGYFYASVYSPKYYNPLDTIPNTHAVIIDKDLNIIHDPNPEYKNITQYPEADKIGYNGIIDVFVIEKVKQKQ